MTRTLRPALVALALGACHHAPAARPAAAPPAASPPAATPKLFDRLGGLDAIKSVVHAFVANVAADDRVSAAFINADGPRLEALLVDQICEATGGPCKYAGRDMRTTHTGMKITDAQFGAVVEDLVKALDAHAVPAKEKDELLGALGGMKGDIVGL